MARIGTITPNMLNGWATEISCIADALCDTGQWTKEEWYTLYNHTIIPLRNAALVLGDLTTIPRFKQVEPPRASLSV